METTKKTFLFVFALLVLTIPAYAGQVTSDQAFEKASQFMKDKTFKMASSMRRSQGQLGNTAASPFFVFNATEGGYVVVSGDDRTRDILGYSTTGTLDMDNLPDNLKWWLEEYARQIEALDGGTLAATMSTEPLSMSAIAPLINTTWNQYAPYNYMCPDVISNLENSAKLHMNVSRKHWQVENNLHWHLDVNFMEDAGKKKNNEALNFSTICKIALAALNNMDDKRPINRKMKVAGWNDDYLLKLLEKL